LVGKPLERVADARAVDAARADASHDLGGVVAGRTAEGRGVGIHHPTQAGEDTAEQNDELGPPLVDEPAFDGNQPRLKQNEQGKGDLDLSPLPVERLLDIGHKERPTVLQVGDHHHADDADDELNPAKHSARASRLRLRQRVHSASHPACRFGARDHMVLCLAGMRYASDPPYQLTGSLSIGDVTSRFRERMWSEGLRRGRVCGVWYTRIQAGPSFFTPASVTWPTPN